MKEILYRLFEHQYLGKEEARNILQDIARGRYNDAQIASLITVFLMRSISVEELAGFRDALLEMMETGGETLRFSTDNSVGFNDVEVNLTNTPLSGTIQLPENETFHIENPYVILERASDGTRIGTFDLTGNPNGQNSARYTLTLRGEYNLNATDRVTVRWMRVTDNTEFSHSCLLEDIMQYDTTITFGKDTVTQAAPPTQDDHYTT